METLREQQVELEAVARGERRYAKERDRQDEMDMAPGEALYRSKRALMESAFREFVEGANNGKAGRRHTLVRHVGHLDPAIVINLTFRIGLNEAVGLTAWTSAALALGSALADHILFTELDQEEPGLMRYMEKKLKRSTGGAHRAGVLRHATKLTTVKGAEWDKRLRGQVGMHLLEMMADVTGLIERVTQVRGKRQVHVIQLTSEVAAWLKSAHDAAALLRPVFLPMIVPPRPWTNPTDGGYLDRKYLRYRMVKVRRAETVDDMFSTEMPEVYAAVNALQETPWRVNRAVLDVLEEVYASGGRIGKMPAPDDAPLPARPDIPSDILMADLPEDQQAAIKAWRAAAAEVYAENAREAGRRVALVQQMSLAREFSAYEQFYFPYFLDFRGRVYCKPTGLEPQGDDISKGLLEFAEGKALGETGGYWLAVHVANCFGQDKLSFEERVQWTQEHTDSILDSALRPLDGEGFWQQADGGDQAWRALAACIEWAGFMVEGDDYVSHLPVALDGSCSGLQHYSAMLRDPRGGAAVNLLPSERKADIYTLVADEVEAVLAEMDDPMAAAWSGKVVRKIVKQPAMTFAYSATVFGMRDQISNAMRSLDATGGYLGEVSYFEAASFLAPIVRKCIEQVVVAAAEGMGWLQRASRVASKVGLPLRWVSPVGLPVLQDERVSLEERVNLFYKGQRIRLTLHKEGTKMDARAQASAVAPNFVHSMDAAHLMRTVNACASAGTRSFAVVHDSFGTHAADTDTLHAILRDEFVRLYETDRLADFREQMLAQLPQDMHAGLPKLPKTGTLDLSQVRNADFFFS